MLTDPHALLPLAYRAAAAVLRSPVLAEEAGERALHQLTLAMLQGAAPHHPKAWLRLVARRSACALLRSDWARTPSLQPEQLSELQAPYRGPRPRAAEAVREQLEPALSPRQRDAITAAMSCNGTRAAARQCGMPPRDFRRHLGAVARKAQALLHGAPDDPLADDAGAQFGLHT